MWSKYGGCWGQPFFTDVSSRATWTSGNTSVATVNSYGQAHGVGGGSTTITAQFRDATYLWTGSWCTASGQPSYSDSGTCNVCDFAITPGAIDAQCSGQMETIDFVARSSSCTICASGSSCSATASGNVEISGSPTFSVDIYSQGHCTVNYFAGPNQQNGIAGTLSVTMTGAFCGTIYSKTHSVAAEVVCP